MSKLIPLSDLVRDRNYTFSGDIYDPTGETAYGTGDEKLGKIEGALTEDSGKIRYLILEVGNWFSSKRVLVPVGLGRFEDNAVYFDSLTKDQVKDMNEYRADQDYSYDSQVADERVLRGKDYQGDIGYGSGAATRNTTGVTTPMIETDPGTTTASTQYGDTSVPATTSTGRPISDLSSDTATAGSYSDTSRTGYSTSDTTLSDTTPRYNYRDDEQSDSLYKTPTKLQLLEERLLVDKEKYTAGSVEIGKRVETRQQSVDVDLAHDEVVIERHPVEGGRRVENATLGADSQTVRLDLEAERANARKETYVTEEVNVGKRSASEHQTVTDSVGREVLDVNKTGDVAQSTDSMSSGSLTDTDDSDLNKRS